MLDSPDPWISARQIGAHDPIQGSAKPDYGMLGMHSR